MFFPDNVLRHTLMELEVDPLVDVIALAEPLKLIVAMLPDTLNKIAGDSNIYSALAFTRKDIQCRLFSYP